MEFLSGGCHISGPPQPVQLANISTLTESSLGAVLSKGGERAHWGPSRTAEVVQAKAEADRWPLGSPGSSGDRWWDSALAWRGRGLAHGLGIRGKCIVGKPGATGEATAARG